MTSPLPGGTGLTWLRVYDWASADDEHGGSPHLHLVCTEAYVVVSGRGRLQTLGPDGFVETPLSPRDVVWFDPGVVHRAVNDGGLEVLVVMQNAGLPEAGDAVLTFPPEVLADPARYAEAASLTQAGQSQAPRSHGAGADAARRRRDLAIEGFTALKERVERDGPRALEDLYAAAAALVVPQLARWEGIWRDGPAAAAERTRQQLTALAEGDVGHLAAGGVHVAAEPAGPEKFGMCGRLTVYEPGGRPPDTLNP